ncbi:MAG: tRNA (N6-isopentenyl adenosine(37)-C2)-methylthiotransferase MiaB, partial [Candidatus Methanomethylophilaceae archaeon]|nr:tRNA (N6-isopentenyl adenosine(37)-C2)-methylthiotransferase MiaB [Candidatus Methanomethylophilaceae archaeon]
KEAETNRPVFCYLQTFGCQQNESDSEKLAGMAEAMGYRLTEEPEQADLIVVNTCAVREHAEKRALSITGQYKHLKDRKPSLVIAVCGCMVSQEKNLEKFRRSCPYVGIAFGTTFLYRFPEILYRHLCDGKRIFLSDAGSPGNLAEGIPVRRSSPHSAYVSIMYGCNNFCTYCIVPFVRGRERSRTPEAILAEIRSLAGQGYREITLLGQNVNSYGRDLPEPTDFPALLEQICSVPGDFLLHFMTSHPKDASERLFDVMASQRKIAHHLHLPVQSGSDRILAAMNRHYTSGSYLETVGKLRKRIPDIVLSSDLIVGFPTETEEDFECTLSLMREVRFDSVFSFLFSPRQGTPAAEMDGQVSESVKRERMKRLLDLQEEISLSRNQDLVGSVFPVLVEGISKTDSTTYTGRTEGGKLVHFRAGEGEDPTGRILPVRITKACPHNLIGEPVSE